MPQPPTRGPETSRKKGVGVARKRTLILRLLHMPQPLLGLPVYTISIHQSPQANQKRSGCEQTQTKGQKQKEASVAKHNARRLEASGRAHAVDEIYTRHAAIWRISFKQALRLGGTRIPSGLRLFPPG